MYAPRRNWDSPQPPTRRLVCPLPPVSGGRGTLAGEKGVGRVPIPTRGVHCGTPYMYVLCGPICLRSTLFMKVVLYFVPLIPHRCFARPRGHTVVHRSPSTIFVLLILEKPVIACFFSRCFCPPSCTRTEYATSHSYAKFPNQVRSFDDYAKCRL